MLDADYPRRELEDRYPRLAHIATVDETAALELSELLLFAPAVCRAARIETDVPGRLVDSNGRSFDARVFDVSETGVQVCLSATTPIEIQPLLTATLHTEDGTALQLPVRFVRVVDYDDDEIVLGFRFLADATRSEDIATLVASSERP